VDGAGNLYVADSRNYTIRKVTPAGVVTTLAGQANSLGSEDGTGSSARFGLPLGVAVDGSGVVYVADSYNSTIRKITPAGVVTTLAGLAGIPGSSDGQGSLARFLSPSGVAVDGSGNAYVADPWNFSIRKVTPDGVVTTLAGAAEHPGINDGTGSAANFDFPIGVAVDESANVYVAEYWSFTIRKVTPAGVVTTLAGEPGSWGSADGVGSAARFANPSGVSVNAAGNLYVADSSNHAIRKGVPVAETCLPDTFTACLIGGRYRVTSRWQNQYAGGQVNALSASQLTDTTAAFWLSGPETYEYMIRISTATDNGRAWIAIPTFTDVEFWVEVTDIVSGQYFEYHSPAGNRTLIYDPYYFFYP
jgi:sugar lactone lactonase YvrE